MVIRINPNFPWPKNIPEGRYTGYQMKLNSIPGSNVTVSLTAKNATVSVVPRSVTITPEAWNQWHDFTIANNQDEIVRNPNPHAASVGVFLTSDDVHFDSITAPDIDVMLEDDDVGEAPSSQHLHK